MPNGSFDADAGAIFDSNLTGAASGPDIRPDWAAALDASVGQFFALSGDDGLTLTVNVRGEVYDRYHGTQPGGDRRVGALSAQVRARARRAVGVACGQQLVRRLSQRRPRRRPLRRARRIGTASHRIDRRRRRRRLRPALRPARSGRSCRAISGEVFSLIGRSAYFQVGYTIDEPWLLSVNGAVRRGDVESTSQQGLPVFLASTAIAPDPAFNDPNLFAYRLPGTTWTSAARRAMRSTITHRSTCSTPMRSPTRRRDLKYRSNIVGPRVCASLLRRTHDAHFTLVRGLLWR